MFKSLISFLSFIIAVSQVLNVLGYLRVVGVVASCLVKAGHLSEKIADSSRVAKRFALFKFIVDADCLTGEQ